MWQMCLEYLATKLKKLNQISVSHGGLSVNFSINSEPFNKWLHNNPASEHFHINSVLSTWGQCMQRHKQECASSCSLSRCSAFHFHHLRFPLQSVQFIVQDYICKMLQKPKQFLPYHTYCSNHMHWCCFFDWVTLVTDSWFQTSCHCDLNPVVGQRNGSPLVPVVTCWDESISSPLLAT